MDANPYFTKSNKIILYENNSNNIKKKKKMQAQYNNKMNQEQNKNVIRAEETHNFGEGFGLTI